MKFTPLWFIDFILFYFEVECTVNYLPLDGNSSQCYDSAPRGYYLFGDTVYKECNGVDSSQPLAPATKLKGLSVNPAEVYDDTLKTDSTTIFTMAVSDYLSEMRIYPK